MTGGVVNRLDEVCGMLEVALNMNVVKSLAIGFAVISLSASAQDSNRYDGDWRASGRNLLDFEFSLRGEEGTFKVFVPPTFTRAICQRAKRPIVVQRATADELTFLVNGSKVLADCPDFVMKFKPIDASTLEGTINGNVFRAVRR